MLFVVSHIGARDPNRPIPRWGCKLSGGVWVSPYDDVTVTGARWSGEPEPQVARRPAYLLVLALVVEEPEAHHQGPRLVGADQLQPGLGHGVEEHLPADLLAALRRLAERSATTPVPPGQYESNPLFSVPDLVDEVAAALGVSRDAAARQLQLHAFARPPDRPTARLPDCPTARLPDRPTARSAAGTRGPAVTTAPCARS